MDTERPQPPVEPESTSPALAPGIDPDQAHLVGATHFRGPKFQHQYGIHIILFLLTLVSTTMAYALLGTYLSDFTVATIERALWYSVPLLIILGAHEFGHYFACRYHDVDATLPYFLPAPLPLTGTLGAVIRIREPFPSKKALFDIGVAGPIAGFLALVPLLLAGLMMSSVVPYTTTLQALHLGDPLLLTFAAKWHFREIAPGMEVALHPMGFAAWWGMLATSLNLMPFGQLDGGHIVYSLLGRRAAWVSLATLGVAILLTTLTLSWIMTAIMMTAMAIFLGLRHPPVVDEDHPLDWGRKLVALFALVMFVLCFTPIPIQTFFGK